MNVNTRAIKGIAQTTIVLIAIIIILGAAFGAYFYYSTLPEPETEQVTVNFVNNTFATEIVQEFIDDFEALNPDIKINWQSFPPGDAYVEKTTALLVTSPEDIDVMLVTFGTLASWVEAEWVTDLEDMENVADYESALTPRFLEFATYKDKLYGLPYFGAEFLAVLNRQFFNQTTLVDPPTTYEEYVQQLQVFQDEGIFDTPAVHGLTTGWYGIIREWEEIAVNMGGMDYSLFDEDWNAEFLDSESAGYKAVEFLADLEASGLLNPTSWEQTHSGIATVARAGLSPFALRVDPHKMIDMNNPNVCPDYAGDFELFMYMDTGATVYRAECFSISKYAYDNKKDDMWAIYEFLKYIGGQGIQKRYATIKGLGFGYQALHEDPEITASWGRWIDLEAYAAQAAKAVPMTKVNPTLNEPWYAEWQDHAVIELQAAVKAEKTIQSALQSIADKAAELRAG